jgi:hypothetical protein
MRRDAISNPVQLVKDTAKQKLLLLLPPTRAADNKKDMVQLAKIKRSIFVYYLIDNPIVDPLIMISSFSGCKSITKD